MQAQARVRTSTPKEQIHIAFDERLRYSIPEASALLKQSRAKTYTDIERGLLKPLKDGARTYIHGSEIVRRSTATSAATA